MVLGLAGTTAALYGSGARLPYTSDDIYYLYMCRKLDGAGLLSVFHPAVQGKVLPPFYRPTSVILFLLAGRLFGADPAPLHWFLLVVRGITLAAALLLFSRALGSRLLGGAAALLLAVTPWGIETVLWPADIPGALMLLLLLGAVLCFLKLGEAGSGRRAGGWGAATVLLALLGLASKEMAVLLPFLLACLPGRRSAAGKATLTALVILDALYVAMRLWMRRHVPVPPDWDYWALLVVPRDWAWAGKMASDVGSLLTGPFGAAWIGWAGAGLLAAGAAVLLRQDSPLPRRWVAFAAAIVLLPIAMTNGLVTARYGYLPYVGVALLSAGAVGMVWRRARWAGAALLAVLLCFQTLFTRAWVGEWSRAAQQNETVGRFLAGRPASEETVLLWIPGFSFASFAGNWQCVSYSVTDTLYPAWMKEIAGRGSKVTPLAVVQGAGGQIAEVEQEDGDTYAVRAPGAGLQRAQPSCYSGRKTPDPERCAEFLDEEGAAPGQDETVVRVRLKRAPGRRFFTLTERGWKEL